VPDKPDGGIDYRFSLANERTLLAWLRTAFALIAGGVVAAKALDFESEVWRWVVAGPPLVAGTALALRSRVRHRAYEAAMRAARPLPAGPDAGVFALGLAAYAVAVIVATALDG
jgi:putative membrane protein